MGGNYLHRTPGFEDAHDVADALLALASEAGARGLPAKDPVYDPLKRELAARIDPARRALFETFAPPAEVPPDRTKAEELVERMVPAIRLVDPLMDAGDRLQEVRLPVSLVHGLNDLLIPHTETLRMAQQLTRSAHLRVTVTPMFAHSRAQRGPGIGGLLDGLTFVRALGQVLRLV